MAYHVRLYCSGEPLPPMACRDFFHSTELFHIIEETPGQKPYMAVATDEHGNIVAHMMAITRRRGSWIPPMLFTQGRIYGEGEYATERDKEVLFGMLLHTITRKLRKRLCFYIEVSDLSKKMFGYRYFKYNHYFPIHWQEVHNSLHSKSPEERLERKTALRIQRCYKQGVVTREAQTEEEVRAFHKLLRAFYRFKFRRSVPPVDFLLRLHRSKHARIFVTLFHEKLIGGCVCALSCGNAQLWYIAAKRKSYHHLHPYTMTIWYALSWAADHRYAHFSFLNVGLPFLKNPFREYILRFGGKPVAKYRWFRFSFRWINNLFS